MAKKHIEENNQDTVEAPVEMPVFDEGVVCGYIDKDGDSYILHDEKMGTTVVLEKTCDDGATFVLPRNSSNRKWARIKGIDASIASDGKYLLAYKASKHFGTGVAHIPNEKLIKYLPEDLQAEYKAIIDRAIEARNADRAKPLTEREKAEKQLAKWKAKLAELNGD